MGKHKEHRKPSHGTVLDGKCEAALALSEENPANRAATKLHVPSAVKN